jgi:hypothetical protein
MKTAMQELLKHFIDEWSSPSDLWNPSKIIDKVESMIEKEKEQIEIAFDLGRDEVTSVYLIDGEDYYNKSYNKNKKETLQEWKAKFTHHCAIKPKNK